MDASSIKAVSELISAVAWPTVVLAIALAFRQAIRDLLDREEVQVTGPAGLGITSKGQRIAAEALVEASADKPGGVLALHKAESEIESAAQGVATLGRSPQLLWVDDYPSNNRNERRALQALGMFVEAAISTEDALARIDQHGQYDVIISDMGRPPDARAGYTLLSALRERGDRTPYVIYASSREPEHFNEAVTNGAVGCTNVPSELVELVSNALRSRMEARPEKATRRWAIPGHGRALVMRKDAG